MGSDSVWPRLWRDERDDLGPDSGLGVDFIFGVGLVAGGFGGGVIAFEFRENEASGAGLEGACDDDLLGGADEL